MNPARWNTLIDKDWNELFEKRSENIHPILKELSRAYSYERKVSILKAYLLKERSINAGKPLAEINPNVIASRVKIKTQNEELDGVILIPQEYQVKVPCIYYIHGGGLMVGSFYDNIDELAQLCLRLKSAVFAIDYRLAPEFHYPAPLEDCLVGLSWLRDNASLFGVDKENIIMMGESAGGALSASLGLMLRDRELKWIKALVLLSPMLDSRNTTASSHQFRDGWPFWPREFNILAWTAYLGSDEKRFCRDPYANPSYAENLEGLPRTYVEVGNIDLFRDETIEFVKRLSKCGNDVTFHLFSKVFHGMDSVIPDSDKVRKILDLRWKDIKSLLK